MAQYIDKDALVAELDKRIKEIEEIGTYLSPKGILTNLLCYITYSSWKEEYIGLLVRGDANAIPCWSLAALFDVLPNFIRGYGKCLYYDDGEYYCGYMVDGHFMLIVETKADNQIDACYEMIIKLNELKLL